MKYINHPFLLLLTLIFIGCHESKKSSSSLTQKSKSVTDSTFNTSCSYLTDNAAGIPVISWAQENNTEKTTQVWYAVFSDSTKTFGNPQLIPTSANVEPHGENMPKIIFQKNGNIMAVYSINNPHPGNPYTGAIYYTRSFDHGKSWTPAQPLISDTSKSFDQRYFDMALLPDGEVGMVWLNNSEPEGSTLYFASTKGRDGFGTTRIIAHHTCQCCRTNILVDSTGIIHVAWRTIFHDSIRDMAYSVSKDSGKTFSSPVRISADNWVVDGCPHTGPSMAVNNDGIHFTWFTMGGGGGVYYNHKDDNAPAFSQRQAVSALPSARHPQIAALPDNDLAIVWDEGVKYKNAIHQRIGLQMRGPNGLLMSTRYLTADSVNSSFAQIKILNNQSALVAFTQDNGQKQEVKYRMVSLKP